MSANSVQPAAAATGSSIKDGLVKDTPAAPTPQDSRQFNMLQGSPAASKPPTAAAAAAPAPAGISADEFQALEQKVLRAVEIVRRERELRAAAEAEAARLLEQLKEQTALTQLAEDEVAQLGQQLQASQAANEGRVASLAGELETRTGELARQAGELERHTQERDAVRLRVEKMLQQMDELL